MEEKIKLLEKQVNEGKKNLVRANEVNNDLMAKINDKESNEKIRNLENKVANFGEKDGKLIKFVG